MEGNNSDSTDFNQNQIEAGALDHERIVQEGKELDWAFLLDSKDYFRDMVNGTFEPTKKTRVDKWLDSKIQREMSWAGIETKGTSDGNGDESTIAAA